MSFLCKRERERGRWKERTWRTNNLGWPQLPQSPQLSGVVSPQMLQLWYFPTTAVLAWISHCNSMHLDYVSACVIDNYRSIGVTQRGGDGWCEIEVSAAFVLSISHARRAQMAFIEHPVRYGSLFLSKRVWGYGPPNVRQRNGKLIEITIHLDIFPHFSGRLQNSRTDSQHTYQCPENE